MARLFPCPQYAAIQHTAKPPTLSSTRHIVSYRLIPIRPITGLVVSVVTAKPTLLGHLITDHVTTFYSCSAFFLSRGAYSNLIFVWK